MPIPIAGQQQQAIGVAICQFEATRAAAAAETAAGAADDADADAAGRVLLRLDMSVRNSKSFEIGP